MKRIVVLVALLLLAALAGCDNKAKPSGGGGTGSGGSGAELVIASGSENQALQPVIERYAREHGQNIRMEYLGSVEMMLQLESGSLQADAVWPANSLWVELGDKKKQVKHSASIMRSPVVLGVKKSVAEKLGWVGNEVRVRQILDAAQAGKLRFMMTSASQSNSGASAYLGYLYAFAGEPEILTAADLQKPKVKDGIKRILGSVDRSAGSSGWLKDLFLKQYDRYDAMVNYEALVIETNRELVGQGKEPLYAVYPVDGLAIADSPLAYLDRGDSAKEQQFLALQQYLQSPEVQKEILGLGRRVGVVGVDASGADRTVFNPDWGIDVARVLSPIRFPRPEVIRQALDLYQTAFRKPSFTVYCLDYSGSMAGQGIQDLKSAMRLLLDQQEARKYYLQSSSEDITVVIPFSNRLLGEWRVEGNNAGQLQNLLTNVLQQQPTGGTDIYTPVTRALDLFAERNARLDHYFPAVILMTDGQSNQGTSIADVQGKLQSLSLNADIPVFGILFGQASDAQLKEMAEYTSGRVFDGRKDLVRAFRDARGYN